MGAEGEKYMQRCLELAGLAKAAGHTAVGAVVVREGQVIGEGAEGAGDVPGLLAHAEVLAILAATARAGSRRLSGAVLFTTVEPCFMCSYLIRLTAISRVVFGTRTKAGGASSAYPFLRGTDVDGWGKPPEVVGGMLEEACLKLLQQ